MIFKHSISLSKSNLFSQVVVPYNKINTVLSSVTLFPPNDSVTSFCALLLERKSDWFGSGCQFFNEKLTYFYGENFLWKNASYSALTQWG